MQRCVHYEQAFEHFLRANRLPYIAVDEARKTLLPPDDGDARLESLALKSFDFVVYAPDGNLLVDVKGRKAASPPRRDRHHVHVAPDAANRVVATGSGAASRDSIRSRTQTHGLGQNWVGLEDVDAMERWERLFGAGFEARFVFLYGMTKQPPDTVFEAVFPFQSRWYALRQIAVADYRREMLPRSSQWRTVHLPAEAFRRLSRPFSGRAAPVSRPLHACGGATAAVS